MSIPSLYHFDSNSLCLQTIFQTVDGYYLDRALNVLQQNILPHNEQMLGLLFSSISNSQRESLSAEEMISPLDLLFEFGELEARFPPDPALRPRVLLGDAVRKCFGISNSSFKWKEETVDEKHFCLVESCEPSTGLRSVSQQQARSQYLIDGAVPTFYNEGNILRISSMMRRWLMPAHRTPSLILVKLKRKPSQEWKLCISNSGFHFDGLFG
jgi:hypothetical protein